MALGRVLKPLLQNRDFASTSDDGSGHHHWRDIAVSRRVKPIPLPCDRLEIARRRCGVVQRRANLLDTHAQHGIGHVRAPPHVLPQLGLRHQATGMLEQIPQDRQRPGTQDQTLVSPPQVSLRHVEAEGSKGEGVGWLHESGGRLRLDTT